MDISSNRKIPMSITELIATTFRKAGRMMTVGAKKPLYGERQVAPTLDGIRPDHIGRYRFAATHIPPAARILDLACGIGYGACIMARETACKSITAVDINRETIAYARKHYASPKIDYIQGDCLDVDLPTSYYDLVVSLETLEHVNEDRQLLERFFRLVKPGCKLILSSPNQLIKPYSPATFPFHVRHYEPDVLSDLLRRVGFNIEEVYSQHNRHSEILEKGQDGAFNVFVCKRIAIPSAAA